MNPSSAVGEITDRSMTVKYRTNWRTSDPGVRILWIRQRGQDKVDVSSGWRKNFSLDEIDALDEMNLRLVYPELGRLAPTVSSFIRDHAAKIHQTAAKLS